MGRGIDVVTYPVTSAYAASYLSYITLSMVYAAVARDLFQGAKRTLTVSNNTIRIQAQVVGMTFYYPGSNRVVERMVNGLQKGDSNDGQCCR
jgi:branched-subunit amino acid transport protein